MKRAKSVFPIFIIFLLLSLLILFFFQNGITKILQEVTLPVQKWAFTTFFPTSPTNLSNEEKLKEENNTLRTQLANTKELERDNQALRDQFQTTNPKPRSLLPADVVGTSDNTIIIDKGTEDTVEKGDIVVVKNNLVGKITKVSPHVSVSTLITHPTTSFTAETVKTSAIGVIKAQGDDSITLEKVVLTDKLEKDDLVMTKGDIDSNGVGFPPELVVGKIVSVNKKESSLFQQSQIKSLINFQKLRIVFVMRGKE